MDDSISYIESHDARLAQLEMRAGEPLTIAFSHLPVYVRRAEDLYGIWSYRATLSLTGLRELRVTGPLVSDDYVSDAVATYLGSRIDWIALQSEHPVDRIAFVMGSGGRIDVHCGHAKLELLERLKHIEDWIGPLR
jgi:hypothetical protein